MGERKRMVKTRKQAVEFQIARKKDDPFTWDLFKSKVLWTFAQENPKMCLDRISEDFIWRLPSLSQLEDDPDATILLAVQKNAPQRTMEGKQKHKGYLIRGIIVGTLITWTDTVKKTRKKTKHTAFEIDLLCSDEKGTGIGTELLKQIETYVSHTLKLDQVVLQALNQPDLIAFYRKQGYDVLPSSSHDELVWMQKTII